MSSDFRSKEQLPSLIDRLVQTYTEDGSISHLGHCPLPNYEIVIAAVEDLKEILFLAIGAAKACTWATSLTTSAN